MTALTEYERKRLENIKKNQSLLSSLAIKSVGPAAKKGSKRPAPSSSTPSKKRGRPATGTDSPLPPKRHATRASVRLSGVGLDPVELQSRLEKEEQELASERQKREELKHSDRPLVAESLRTGPSSSLTSNLFSSLAHTIAVKPIKTMKEEEVNLEYSPGDDEDYDRLAGELKGLQLRSLNKVCPNRIYSMNFHPDPSKSLLFMGEKLGGVGIWDALGEQPAVKSEDVEDEDHVSTTSTNTADVSSKPSVSPAKPVKQEEEDDDEEDRPEFVEGVSYFIQAHARYSAVSAIQAHPSNPHLVCTSSYDRTIRELNFESQQSTEVIDGQALNPDEDTLFSAFEFANQGREIWASDNAGGLVHRDLRQPKTTARRWTVSKKKVGCLSLCPNSADRLAVTAGLNREMRLWDLRALSGLSPSSGLAEVEKDSCLATYAHGLACSSAYFNPAGDKILSTSYDDLVRIWDFEPSARDSWLDSHPSDLDLPPSFQARHDNQTGRWVSVMKARWCPNPRFPCHFTVGNMAQKLDIYNPKGELLTQLSHHALTTVPAVTAQHPSSSNLQVAGATAGGKVYLWT
ncbi:uncharacterized protein PGTG_08782 [Puccinia graminis f. sp. tritici CRL 75-36-700-3]|uniref:DNA damage-binding protein CMR1 n=1 Tax=Puccinia graminis f. sp. tritici (strain CRL 75-36-700-3 / race SCCL) TaxID=418459 RepID=E3KE32_PUCGT|nr:uncharacterized protein PGTG_08782 [Puccinia graminis f. sp. tritici CRL 75-36-700-3]EFP82586.1 hypothetical protein PGTG_08782 [Puccinia graminis f. sp. tritici CRL 75-36-700-3]